MKNTWKWILGFLLVILASVLMIQINKTETSQYSTRIFELNSGYGYEISFNSKVVIKQDNIPAIAEKHMFCSKDDATKIAALVITKLENKENPRITIAELNANAIAFNCIN